MERYIGLDIGEKRIGVAASDPLGFTAQPVEVIQRSSREKDYARIASIARDRGARIIVVGLPRNMDGSLGFQARRIERETQSIADKYGFDIAYQDERLTTAQAQRAMIEDNVSRDKRKTRVDGIAAQLILQSYLDTIGNKTKEASAMAKDIINLEDYRDRAGDMEDGDGIDIVELVDEDGNIVYFEHITTIEHQGAEYVLLVPAYDEEDEDEETEEDDEGLVVLRIVPGGDEEEDAYEGVTDEKLLAVIYQKYLEEAESEGFDE